ncbi:MAG: glycosyltransferase family 4 protein [Phycisphaerae bacterium]
MHVCFVALKALPVLVGGDVAGRISGADVQQAVIARGLLERGWRVTFVVFDDGPDTPHEVDGIRLERAYARDAGWPRVRFIHPRWTGLHAAIGRARPDVVYQRAAGCETGIVGCYRRLHPRCRFVFACGSDSDVAADLHYLRTARDRGLYRFGLRAADAIVTQSTQQTEQLRANFKRDGVLIPSAVARPDSSVDRGARPATPPRLLWVGRVSYEKRPEWFVELAAERAGWRFALVGDANHATDHARSVLARARQLPNLTLHGAVAHAEMATHYDAADLLVCTSHWEGFPNTFLEAWSRGAPVASTVDPDGVIQRHGLGVVADSPAELEERCDHLLRDAARYRAMSLRCQAYVAEHHRVERAAQQYELLFEQLLAGRKPRRGRAGFRAPRAAARAELSAGSTARSPSGAATPHGAERGMCEIRRD